MNKRKTILAGVTAVAVVLSSGVMAFAATTDTAGPADSRSHPCKAGIRNDLTTDQMAAVGQARADSMKEAAAQLVDSGVLTQEIADQLSEGHMASKDKAAFVSLTEEQRTALHDASGTILASKLAALVENGILTQEQADRFLKDGRPGHMGPGGMPGFGKHHEGKERPDLKSGSESEAQTF